MAAPAASPVPTYAERLTFASMYPPELVNAENPLPSYEESYWDRMTRALPDAPPVAIASGIIGGIGDLAMQANEAMPWGGDNPAAIGMYPGSMSPEGRDVHSFGGMNIDPSVLVPFAQNVAGMATTGSLAAPAVRNATGMGIRAYHGSPHDFDRFSMDKIGTGEGAQAYGHGLYFAENEGVARGYRDALKMKGYDNNPMYAEAVNNHGFGAKEFDQFESIARQTVHEPDALANAFFDRNAEWSPLRDDPVEYQNVRDFAQKYIDSTPQGRMYEVDINASPDEFLDYSAPLDRQSPKVRQALEGLGVKIGKRDSRSGGDMLGEFGDNPAAASQALRDAGIKGIRYEDAGSRFDPAEARRELTTLEEELGFVTRSPAPDPVAIRNLERQIGDLKSKLDRPQTSNLVVFDEDTISILKKYGIAGLTAGGAGAAMLGGTSDPASAAAPSYSTGGRF